MLEKRYSIDSAHKLEFSGLIRIIIVYVLLDADRTQSYGISKMIKYQKNNADIIITQDL